MSSDANIPFEGAEKLLEIWFARSANDVSSPTGQDGKIGLRAIQRQAWEDMLKIVKCKILSVVEGEETDAYLLRLVQLFMRLVTFSAPPLTIANPHSLYPHTA